MDPLHDIIETPRQPALLLGWQWLIVVLALLAIAAGIYVWLKKHRPQQTPAGIPAYTTARQRLGSIKFEEMSPSALAVETSLIVREYLQQQFDDPALFQTDEEFHARSLDFMSLPREAAVRLAAYFDQLSALKYAPAPQLTSEKEKLIMQTHELLSGLESTTPRELSSTPPPHPLAKA